MRDYSQDSINIYSEDIIFLGTFFRQHENFAALPQKKNEQYKTVSAEDTWSIANMENHWNSVPQTYS